ncbi:MAG: SurA N-terminal domain-containing protein, partial [Beijerinckiaceae bacterium]
MLEALRNASKNWLGKIVLTFMFGLLILSFAVWGIGDIFSGFGSGTVATA